MISVAFDRVVVIVSGRQRRGELAHRLEESVPATARDVLHHHEVEIDELGDRLDRMVARCADDGGEGGKIESAFEDRQGAEARLGRVVEKSVTPVDRRLHRPVAVDPGTQVGEEEQPLVEAGGDVRDRQDVGACSGEFDRQGNAIELAAEATQVVGVLVGDLDGRPTLAGALPEELDRPRPLDLCGRRTRPGRIQRADRQAPLARDVQGAARGRDDAERRHRFRQLADDGASAGDDVFAVVEDEDQLASPERLGQRLADRAIGPTVDVHRGRDQLGDVTVGADGGEVDEPQAIGRQVHDGLRRSGRQRRLADPSRPEQGHETRRLDRCHHPVDDVVTADEFDGGPAEVAGLRVERPQRLEARR